MFNYNIRVAPYLFIRGETVDLTKPLEDEMEEKMDSHQEEQTNWIRSTSRQNIHQGEKIMFSL